jgi:hypothetical protein
MKSIFIVIDVDEDFSEPIISAVSEELAIKELDKWCGFGESENVILIEDKVITYDKEYQGSLIRKRSYKTKSFFGEIYLNNFEIYILDLIEQ